MSDRDIFPGQVTGSSTPSPGTPASPAAFCPPPHGPLPAAGPAQAPQAPSARAVPDAPSTPAVPVQDGQVPSDASSGQGLPAGVPSTADLPAMIRRQLAELAAVALGDLPQAEVPAALRRIRAFAPVRRARVAAALLLAGLDTDAVLRRHTGLLWSNAHPDLAAEIPGLVGDRPPDRPSDRPSDQPSDQPSEQPSEQPSDRPSDRPSEQPSDRPSDRPPEQPPDRPSDQLPDQPADQPSDQPSEQPPVAPLGWPDGPPVPDRGDDEAALVGAFLTRPQGWPELVGVLVGRLAEQEARRQARHAEAAAQVRADAVVEELDRARAELARAQAQVAVLAEEIAGLRRDQRRLRADADRARAAARAAEQEAARAAREAQARSDEAAAALRRAAEQAAEATEQLAQARRLAREGRTVADVRARLLLDTIVDAAAGLRRELALPPVTQRPADLIQPLGPPGATRAPSPPTRAQAGDDPALLEHLLALPQAHLVVDGYNVTKTGYGTLPLAEQRRRLVEALGVLAVRTASEVTCCFDGAEVDARGSARRRGVRVIFSDPGTTADELIHRLVRAEPTGRPVVVVSSDAEVAASSRAAGARAVPSTALLRLLGGRG